MSTILYFDCSSGISGDMCLGSLMDLGVPLEHLLSQLEKLPVDGYRINVYPVERKGIGAAKVDIIQIKQQDFRHLPEIEEVINNSSISNWVKEKSLSTFHKLALAEAKVHQTTVEKIHFHEVGALDSILDIIGTFICIEYLNPDKIVASHLPLGGGFVKCAHGVLPVPTPATIELLKGVPINNFLTEGELVTPTGAALITTLASSFSPYPTGIIENIGYGAGTKDFNHPNVLRTILLKPENFSHISNPSSISNMVDAFEHDTIIVIETTVDDMTGEELGYLLEKIFEAGALDCFYTPIFMKKNRPGQKLTILFNHEIQDVILNTLFANSSTFGVRIFTQERIKLSRRFIKVTTPYGQVTVKIGFIDNKPNRIAPEYKDCAKLAKAGKVSLATVYQAALTAYASLAVASEKT